MTATTDPDLQRRLYRSMRSIRSFEEKVAELFYAGRLPGFVHLYVGQEAVATGVCANLRDDDVITSTHRGHGHLIAKGARLDRMMAELYGGIDGYCHGKGGSMHIADFSVGIYGANGIVGGGLPIAVGAGLAARVQRSDRVAVAFFGDGASNEGTFGESLNLASIWKLPVIFVCENNGFTQFTPTEQLTAAIIAERAKVHVPGVVVEADDVVTVHEAAREAVARARSGAGPTLIEARQWRSAPTTRGKKPSWRRVEVPHQGSLEPRCSAIRSRNSASRSTTRMAWLGSTAPSPRRSRPRSPSARRARYRPRGGARRSVRLEPGSERHTPAEERTMAVITITEAMRDAIGEELERDPNVIVYGEDVELSVYGAQNGLVERFGRERIWNAPSPRPRS